MAPAQRARASHPRPPAGGSAYAAGSLPQTADGPARTPIAPLQAGDPHATLAIDRWNNEGGRIYEGIVAPRSPARRPPKPFSSQASPGGRVLIGAEHGVPLEGVAAVRRGVA